MRRTTTPLIAAAALALVLGACGNGSGEPTTAATPEASATTPTSTPATTPAAPETTPPASSAPAETSGSTDEDGTEDTSGAAPTEDASSAAPSSDSSEPGGDDARWISPESPDQSPGGIGGGGDLHVVDVRAGIHEYYDRVVVDLEGSEHPQWVASYTTEALEDGSGEPLDLAGPSYLHVSLSGFRYPEAGEDVVNDVYEVGGSHAQQAHVSAPFEGMIQVHLGMDTPRPYRIFVLEDPLRLVVDVESES